MSVRSVLTLAAAGAYGLAGGSAAFAASIGPTPYTSFAAHSPFASVDFSGGYLHLETFEGGSLGTPGVTASAGSVTGPGGITDSVDEDDGLVDGSGQQGRSFFGDGATGIRLTFDAAVLGGLPTHAGIVWTDGAAFNTVTFRAFGPGNVSLGEIVAPNIGDGNFQNGTAEDRFFGWIDANGIESIHIFNSLMTGGGSGIDVDHLQYALVPEPSTYALFLAGIALVGFGVKRRMYLPR